MKNSLVAATAAVMALFATAANAVPTFVNGITLSGTLIDASGVPGANQGRVGYFSDIYYSQGLGEWWGLSDRGPGGGLISYDTRVQRFTLDINNATGAISNFQVAQTVKFTDPNNVLGAGAGALNGLAPTTSSVLGRSFDPEGFVIHPKTGNFLVSDEYGPSLLEFDRNGVLLRRFNTPANLVPKVASATNYSAPPLTLTAGREPNRGFEGLAISPDGKYAYAMLQNGTIQDGWSSSSGGTRGAYSRIVKFDTATGDAVAQFAYKLESSAQGRGISALVAINDNEFFVLERNNRGVGVGANVASPDKNVYKINLAGASDVTGVNLPATGNLPSGVIPVQKGAKIIDLDANTLAALGNKSPEKWEGLAIGPQLANGAYMFLAGTDNDYSVTQSGQGTQFDVYFNFALPDPYLNSIQCPLDQTTNCFFNNGGAAATLDSNYQLLPGVLHSYYAAAGDSSLTGYVVPVPEPGTLALFGAALALLVLRRRA